MTTKNTAPTFSALKPATFGQQKTFALGSDSNPSSVSVADVNSDGNVDLVTSKF
jgi:hypothetical protein